MYEWELFFLQMFLDLQFIAASISIGIDYSSKFVRWIKNLQSIYFLTNILYSVNVSSCSIV